MTLHGTELYRRLIAYDADFGMNAMVADLLRRVWKPTPWMADVYTGSCGGDRERDIRDWCVEHYGEEAFVIGDKPGAWQRGGVTVFGWTWMGFDTEAKLNEFLAAWPTPEGVER